MFPFYTPWKDQKIKGFLFFRGYMWILARNVLNWQKAKHLDPWGHSKLAAYSNEFTLNSFLRTTQKIKFSNNPLNTNPTK